MSENPDLAGLLRKAHTACCKERLAALKSLQQLGRMAQPVLADLRELLDDSSLEVRVYTASLIFDLDPSQLEDSEVLRIAHDGMSALDQEVYACAARLYYFAAERWWLGQNHGCTEPDDLIQSCSLTSDPLEPGETLVARVFEARDHARVARSEKNLEWITAALLKYKNSCGCFPLSNQMEDPDSTGRSWRAILVPTEIKGSVLSRRMIGDRSPKVCGDMPRMYMSPRSDAWKYSRTTYLSPVCVCRENSTGTDTNWMLYDAIDTMWKTVIVFEADVNHAIYWLKNEDRSHVDDAITSLFRRRTIGELFGLIDGSVTLVPIEEKERLQCRSV